MPGHIKKYTQIYAKSCNFFLFPILGHMTPVPPLGTPLAIAHTHQDFFLTLLAWKIFANDLICAEVTRPSIGVQRPI
jgi:hypothetical protein